MKNCYTAENIDNIEEISEWWEKRYTPKLTVKILSGTGILISTHDKFLKKKNIAVGWLYMDTGGSCCALEWFATNPENSLRESHEGLEHVIRAAKQIAKESGYSIMYSAVGDSSRGMHELLKSERFHSVERFITLFVTKL
jgi:hypothetical protein